ncbi:MAG: hypothetical protein C0444_11640 [Microbacterium sp.]|nr:hypothetical protein [Microbacterium sp.]MBA4345674.1 hypothetical protein [Microbacterium sp.]
MANSPEPTAPDSSASPYGPADGVEQLFGATAEAPAAPAETVTPEATAAWVHRGRRILTIATWITAGLSIALTIGIVILGVLNVGAADLVAGELTDTLVWSSIFAAPISFTIAMNLLVWRAMLRALSRRTRGQAVAIVIVVSIALAFASVLLVTGLLFAGFLVGVGVGASMGF